MENNFNSNELIEELYVKVVVQGAELSALKAIFFDLLKLQYPDAHDSIYKDFQTAFLKRVPEFYEKTIPGSTFSDNAIKKLLTDLGLL